MRVSVTVTVSVGVSVSMSVSVSVSAPQRPSLLVIAIATPPSFVHPAQTQDNQDQQEAAVRE
jgi:hypothetical protein